MGHITHAVSGSPGRGGTKWAQNPCRIGVSTRGVQLGVLYSPCHLKVSRVGRNQNAYIAPTVSGSTKKGRTEIFRALAMLYLLAGENRSQRKT